MLSKNSYEHSVQKSSKDRSGEFECPTTLAVRRYIYDGHTQTHEPRGGQSRRFIKGPIPLDWLSAANSLPGKAGAVGLALWFLVGVRGTTTIKLTRQIEIIAGCGRKAIYTALTNLETAGLVVVVDRHVGERATVRICDQSVVKKTEECDESRE